MLHWHLGVKRESREWLKEIHPWMWWGIELTFTNTVFKMSKRQSEEISSYDKKVKGSPDIAVKQL